MIFSKKDIQEILPAGVVGRNVTHPKRQLVALVRTSYEKETSERLPKMGIENFLPIQQEVHQWSDHQKVTEHVLPLMIIFAHVDMYEQKEVLTLGSISRYMALHRESTSAVTPDGQTHRFKFMSDCSDEAINMSTTPLSPETKVKVIKGPLFGLRGELVTVNGESKVAVRLTMLGCTFIDISIGCVEPLEK